MKKFIVLITALLCATFMNAQTFSHYDYPYSDSVFNNPERGFYKYTERSDTKSSLSLETLVSFREMGYSLIYRIFYMRDFVNTPISKEYLEKIREDFSKMREAGIKGVIRFAYTSSMVAPYGDATPSQMNNHINQLKPLLIENADVIMVLQAGFIGAWGEWYYTDYFATGTPWNVTAEDLQERKVLVENLLEALPSERMIQLRYVGYKMKLYDSVPVTLQEAYSGTPKSRISHHNDCFVSSDNDVGSYQNIIFEKNYLEKDSKYTSIGGETCDWFPPRSNCDTSTYEMERFHWSFINQDYYGLTINEWEESGCYDEMLKRLGYRYSLVSSKIQDSSKHNGTFSISFKLKNHGYSNPINPRDVEIVLKHKATGKLFFSRIDTEIRKQELNTNFEFTAHIGIPSFMPNGDYEAYLNLPDPKPTLHNNPDFSIRLANPQVWDKKLGMNLFEHTVHINNNANCSEYTGNNYFLGFNNYQSGTIQVDGNTSDWNNIPASDSSTVNGILKRIKIYSYNDTLFFLLQGTGLYENCQIFIDADVDTQTGMNYWSWSNDNGIDYLVQNNELLSYNGPNGSSNWNWTVITNQLLVAKNSTAMELAVPLKFFNPSEIKMQLRFGVKNVDTDWTTGEFLPLAPDYLLMYQISPYIEPPQLYLTSFCQSAIVSIAPEQQDTSSLFIVERKNMAANEGFIPVSTFSGFPGSSYCKDNDLVKNSGYSYRAYRLNNNLRSPYSEIIAMTTGDCSYKYPDIVIDGVDLDWNAIVPLGTVNQDNTVVFLKTYCSNNYLNMLISGDSIVNYSLFIDTDNNPLTGENNWNWKTSGFEFTCTKDSLYKHGLTGATSKIDSLSKNGQLLEFKIPLDLLGIENLDQYLNFAALVQLNEKELYIPFKNSEILLYERMIPPAQPENFSVRNSVSNPSSKLIVTWDKCTDCNGYVLTRTDLSNNESITMDLKVTENQFIDSPLKESNPYQYVLYSYNFGGKSSEAGPILISTTDINDPSSPDTYELLLWPVPSKDEVYLKLPDTGSGSITIALYALDGKLIYTDEAKWDSASDGTLQLKMSTKNIEKGVYLLHVFTGKNHGVKKLIKE